MELVHIAQTFATIVGFCVAFTRVISFVKALLFTKDALHHALIKLKETERETLIKQHVFDGHKQKFAFCTEDACASLE